MLWTNIQKSRRREGLESLGWLELWMHNPVLSFIFLWGEYMEAENIGCKIRCQSWEGRKLGKQRRLAGIVGV